MEGKINSAIPEEIILLLEARGNELRFKNLHGQRATKTFRGEADMSPSHIHTPLGKNTEIKMESSAPTYII